MRWLLIFLSVCLILVANPALAQDRYAVFVADMDTGEVLHARQADAPRHPASLAKMMTLYLTFEALNSNALSLGSLLHASKEATSRPSSKLGLKTGETIKVEDAIRALVLQSANDVAVVLAEHLAGSETAFAQAMTSKAQQLGLSQTRFTNASGLHSKQQVTTARDMARLAFALRRDFPQFMSYFSEHSFRWKDQTHYTHNDLIGTLEGVDGMKTGYIQASGYNIATTAQRGNHRLVAIVMGGASASVRDAHARELIDAGFAALNAKTQDNKIAQMSLPRLNPIREHTHLTAELRDANRSSDVGSSPTQKSVEIEFTDSPQADLPTSPAWSIQVGAFKSKMAAQARLESVAEHLGSRLLQSASMTIDAASHSGLQLWRARYNGFKPDQARMICQQLRSEGEECFAVAPNN